MAASESNNAEYVGNLVSNSRSHLQRLNEDKLTKAQLNIQVSRLL